MRLSIEEAISALSHIDLARSRTAAQGQYCRVRLFHVMPRITNALLFSFLQVRCCFVKRTPTEPSSSCLLTSCENVRAMRFGE